MTAKLHSDTAMVLDLAQCAEGERVRTRRRLLGRQGLIRYSFTLFTYSDLVESGRPARAHVVSRVL